MQRRSCAAPLLATLLLPLGCGGAPAVGPSPVPLPGGDGSDKPTKTEAATAATGEPGGKPARPPSPFFPVAVHAATPLQLFPLGSFVLAAQGTFSPIPIRVDGAGARIDRSLFTGLRGGEDNAFVLLSVSGDLPKSGSLTLNIPGERGGTDVTYAWRGAGWERVPEQPMPPGVSSAYYMGGIYATVPFGGGTLYEIMDPKADDASPVFVFDRGGGAPAPQMTPGKGCKTAVLGHADLVTLPSGELFGLGAACAPDRAYNPYFMGGFGGPLAVERWAKGARKGTVDVLPGSEGLKDTMPPYELHAVGPSEVFALVSTQKGDPYLARWDGRAWTNVSPVGMGEPAGKLWRTRDGATWLAAETHLQRLDGAKWTAFAPPGKKAKLQWVEKAPDDTFWARREKDLLHLGAAGAWENVALPEVDDGDALVPEAVSWNDGEMFVVASDRQGEITLLSVKKREKVLDLATAEDAGNGPTNKPGGTAGDALREEHAFGRVTPATPACKELFVVLYKLAKVAPPDYDFPLTRQALKGHTELSDVSFAETEDGGRRYFVGFVPNFKKGQDLVKLVKDEVKGATPQLLCGKPPKQNRSVRIDLRTGNLVK
jgi:hypothetical protein